MIRTSALSRVSEFRAMAVARSRVEAKYFDGRPVLFPATVRAWAKQLERTEQAAAFAERLSELDGLDPSALDDPDSFAAQVERFVADHVEPARLKAFDELGEGHRAMSVAMRWLGPTLG